ncbi:adenylosuccinate synthase [Candidatus Thorarchaeota archaeon]|nr:MAG: adenylosuccinate synthase [Candidatus Thorarchaeota archaeon]
MSSLVVLGLQWGDEGKGKVVDYLSKDFDIVVRFQGGNNAGHTVKIGDDTHKFRLLPSGAIRGKRVVIGNGVVLDPQTLTDEIVELRKADIKIDLLISNRAHVITPYHIKIDELQELEKGDTKIGTTRRGIGPTYSNKIDRIGLRVADFLGDSLETVDQFQEIILAKIQRLFEIGNMDAINDDFERYISLVRSLKPFVGDTGEYLRDSVQRGDRILYEGAQGTLLDIDHGSYPFVTSSNCSIGGVSTGTGVPPSQIGEVLGVVKAYTTRVGAGPFPTEIEDSIESTIRTRGKEFGTVTGRPRRCGWLDLVALRYAVVLNDAKFLALTKLDVLSGIGPLKVCTRYESDGIEISSIPANAIEYDRVHPVYEELDGWDLPKGDSWNGILKTGLESLPENLIEYLRKIESFTRTEVKLISVGPRREETMVLDEKWLDSS